MPEQKLEPELNLSLSLSVPERMMCSVLCSGYDPETDTWRLILLYQGSLDEIQEEIPFTYVPLLGRYAIIRIATDDIERLLTYPQILYLELSRPLYLGEITGMAASCLNASPFLPGEVPPFLSYGDEFSTLTGRGTAIAVIDSGVDFRHPDFRNPDGTTRILTYWDQSLAYDGANPYGMGVIFSEDDLNLLLLSGTSTGTDAVLQGNLSQQFDTTTSGDFSNQAGTLPSPAPDLSGHGTHVAGICAGNGRSSGGRNHGAAPEAALVIVKLKNEAGSVYSDYASLMMAVDYVVRFASQVSVPLSINISYGSNDGAHDGNSLIEQFLKNCIYYGKNTITVATGNEGLTRRHSSAVLPATATRTGTVVATNVQTGNQAGNITSADRIAGSNIFTNNPAISGSYSFPFSIAPGEQNLYLQLWKSPADLFEYQLVTPGQEAVSISGQPGIYTYTFADNVVQVSVSESTPYQPKQEVFLSFSSSDSMNQTAPGTADLFNPDSDNLPNTDNFPGESMDSPPGTNNLTNINNNPDTDISFRQDRFLSPGIWQLVILPRSVTDGLINVWLPSREATNSGTGFLNPVTDMTFTIPSTADNVISVGGYDSSTDVFASFSGQGYSNSRSSKPDLCAPAVNILSTAPGASYSIRSGTSMAAPFVSGTCALLMEWGIVKGNDPFLFGEKVKGALWRSSRALPAFRDYPNAAVGWGKLCFAR